MIGDVWASLGGDPSVVDGLDVPTAAPYLASPLSVGELASATVMAALLAAAELGEARGGVRPVPSVDGRHVAAAFRSDRHFRLDGAAGKSFAPMSAFFRASDGWVRLHANYPHHRAAALRVLEATSDDERQVADAVRRWRAADLEEAVVSAGGVAAALRTPQEWHSTPQGAAVAALPLVDRTVLPVDERVVRPRPPRTKARPSGNTAGASSRPSAAGDVEGPPSRPSAPGEVAGAPSWAMAAEGQGSGGVAGDVAGASPRVSPVGDTAGVPSRVAGVLPADGFRVLDLTRVIAGPVGTRMLAALGADVLRVASPRLPELPRQALDGGPGKRSTHLDFAAHGDRARFERLLRDADVLVQGYRPGALEAFGLDPVELARRHPHLVTVTLSAWGHAGPWAHRRGFDSLVQVATGIAALTGDGERPGVLPAQALDHGTGYLVAAAALRGLAVREREGRVTHARVALARTAELLLAGPLGEAGVDEVAVDPAEFLVEYDTGAGRVSLIAPPGTLDGRPLSWPHGPPDWGADAPEWR